METALRVTASPSLPNYPVTLAPPRPMKFTIVRSRFGQALKDTARFVPQKPTHPLLGCILLEADADTQRLTLTAFDLSQGLQYRTEAQVPAGGGGRLALPGKLLDELVARLPDGDVVLEALQSDNSDDTTPRAVTLTYSGGRCQLQTLDPEEYPQLPRVAGTSVVLNPDVLREGIAQTAWSASTDETRQVLCGIHIVLSGNQLELASLDGSRLSVFSSSVPDRENAETFEVTIPVSALREVQRLLDGSNGFSSPNIETAEPQTSQPVTLSYEPGQLSVELTQMTLASRALEGAFPDYHSLLPDRFQRQLIAAKKPLLNALERLALFVGKDSYIQWSVEGNSQTLTLSTCQGAGEVVESLPVRFEGEDFRTGFNLYYLRQALKILARDEALFQFNRALQPVLLTPPQQSSNAKFLLVPMGTGEEESEPAAPESTQTPSPPEPSPSPTASRKKSARDRAPQKTRKKGQEASVNAKPEAEELAVVPT
ncbi:DNA polymerase III subunit beta [Lusitaniella coriacea]|uniref:DNA polymerase III subunit beta n=1 Tax=Lusitaniella coriacea TaxID=1983105 RepID=UPI003CF6573F